MDLSTVDTEELVARFKTISERFDEITREIGPSLEKMGRLSKEMALISEELKKRDG